MGLLDRAFGADKKTMLMHRLAMHWRAVESHYENYLKKNQVDEDLKVILNEIQKLSQGIADEVENSIKGFGVISTNNSYFSIKLEEAIVLHSKINVVTDKNHWLPEVVSATRSILAGNSKEFQSKQYWFSD